MTPGPQSLGRIKSDPDPRNYRLAAFLEPAPLSKLDILNDLIQRSRYSKKLKAWVDEATATIQSFTPPPPTYKQWGTTQQLDQADKPHCVGFAWAQYSNAEPVPNHYTDSYGHDLYYACKVVDNEPLTENGSSIHTGATVMRNRKRIDGYAWTTDLDEIKQWALTKGPVTVGTLWLNDMFQVDFNGFLHPTGGIAGGHAYLLIGYDSRSDVFTFQNSWGRSWGDNGFFKMKAADWFALFQRDSDGEACVSVELELL